MGDFLQTWGPGSTISTLRPSTSGLRANGAKRKLLPRCRELLGVGPADEGSARGRATDPEAWPDLAHRLTGRDPTLCPVCQTGHLILIESVRPLGPLSGDRATARAP